MSDLAVCWLKGHFFSRVDGGVKRACGVNVDISLSTSCTWYYASNGPSRKSKKYQRTDMYTDVEHLKFAYGHLRL